MATMRPCLQGTPAKCHSVVAPCQKEGFKYLRCSASHFGHGSRNSIVGRAPVVRGKRDYAALVEGRAETEGCPIRPRHSVDDATRPREPGPSARLPVPRQRCACGCRCPEIANRVHRYRKREGRRARSLSALSRHGLNSLQHGCKRLLSKWE